MRKVSVLLASLVLIPLGCSDGSQPPGTSPTPGSGDSAQGPAQKGQPAAGGHNVDILFLVDDSESMLPLQLNLTHNFPVLIDALKDPTGGLPNLHIAVTTSNMGAGAFSSGELGCMSSDAGNFITSARQPVDATACTANHLNAGAHFIEYADGGRTRNFTGDIDQTFSCLAAVGAHGCGFEQQLGAVRAALGDPKAGILPPAGNAGFLRDDALLAIVILTNEDDCSMPADSQLVDMSSNQPGDPLGPVASFRCTEYGILCNGQKPPRTRTGELAPCVSNDALATTDPTHSLTPTTTFIDYFRRLKADPQKLLVASIAAPTNHVAVKLNNMDWPTLDHSCSAMNGAVGDPAVRLKQVVDAVQGTSSSVCDDSYAPAMQGIAAALQSKM